MNEKKTGQIKGEIYMCENVLQSYFYIVVQRTVMLDKKQETSESQSEKYHLQKSQKRHLYSVLQHALKFQK